MGGSDTRRARKARGGSLLIIALVLVGLVGPGTQGNAARTTHALFFGDSLFAGNGAVPRRPVQVETATKALGWQARLDTFGGTGYTTGGPHGRPYLERLKRDGFLRTPYDVIVLEGGTNDAHHGAVDRLRENALAVLDYLHQRQPKARVVLVGGFAPAGVPSSPYREADRLLAGVAHDRGLTYISQLTYASTAQRGFYSVDHLHPTAVGYREMGRDLVRELQVATR
ncbi:MAG: 31, gp31 [Frankiales bacterium]|nr:31, gp31 [Frankiales bacterium]